MATATASTIETPASQTGPVTVDHSRGRLTIAEFDPRKHDAIITILNPESGDHRTFWIRTMGADEGRYSNRRLVFLLTGPDISADGDWRPFGDAKSVEGITVWAGYAGPNGERFGKQGQWTIYQQFARMLNMPERFTIQGAEYMISGRCRKCGRPLTNPESVKSGLGPICAGRE